MKTEALVELLLDSFQSNMSPLVGPSRQQQSPAPRRVSTRSSTRVSSLRSRGTSGSSSSTSLVASSSNIIAHGSPRTSKSKLTQYKLGVGRPSAVAGSSLRASSRSSSTSKAIRGKTGRAFKPPEATIVEEPESTQSTQLTNQNADRVSSSTSENNDVVTRLGRLESTFREADVKRQLESLRNIPSQVAYLKASVQQREAEIQGLRGELNVCKAEVLTLRSEVSKIPFLEDQLKALKDTLEQLKSTSSTVIAKGKMTRRVPTPFAESNVNSNTNAKTTPVLDPPAALLTVHSSENPFLLSKSPPGASEVALGKRPCNPIAGAGEGDAIRQEENARHMMPDRKRARTGAERRPLQEKVIEPKPEPEKPTPDHGSGEDCAGSAGSSASGPSTQPSVSTPPPPQAPDNFAVDAQQGEMRSDDMSMLDFCNAASSTPRDDIFNYFDDGESFSQLSVTKLGARIAAADANANGQHNSSPQHLPQEPRRISSTVARPRTPPRPSGHARFRVSVDNLSPVREDPCSPFDPYAEGMFTLPFGETTTPVYPRRDAQPQVQNRGMIPTNMPIALGYGLGTAAPGVIYDSPIRQPPRTMFGTELHHDTRFGDFGRDGIAGSSNMEFW
ncbi:hypothetical protein ACEPAH_452 [Sanghuangporus vaninii]